MCRKQCEESAGMKYNCLLFKEGAELCHKNMCQENKYFSILNNINLRFHNFLVE